MTSRTTPDLRPLYAAAGLTDLIASALRDRLTHTQAEAVQRWTGLRQQLPQVPLALSRIARDRLTGLQAQAGQAVAQAESTYDELAGRGRGAVQKWMVRVQAAGAAATRGPDTTGPAAERQAAERPAAERPATRRPATKRPAGSPTKTAPPSRSAGRGTAKKSAS